MSEERPRGPVVEGWQVPPAPPADLVLDGNCVRLEPLQAERHAALLHDQFDGHDWIWDYMGYGPFHSAAAYHRWMHGVEDGTDPKFFALWDLETKACVGVTSYLRITPAAGSIEVGNIHYAPALQRTRAATEAMALMMQWAFDAGYRRYEWKCDALNMPSRRAAQRLGFSYEGTFRKHLIVKGRSRDTAWFAITDDQWPALKEAYDVWLSPANFDAQGRQQERLGDLTRLVRVSGDPLQG
ncbi:GNAT family N-acetyltransferase [Pseudooceanicola nanhaiensis]|uniref:GNAT family N-acetyltransferase n=1 Tax=Pseudooceanicola nanhaiensis TaxID=375761 RepID=UPI001CD63D8D|nr:GNAT family protein [Pseudooceanicola nanhaiensis]MCA0922401.1 GNAT family N-acetyltransferase [Pseudooceanicola nanhaiensis]